MHLTIDRIGKHYNSQWLFRNINFEIQKGQSTAVLGKNGSGKSTLLQIIFGLVQSSEGEVKLDGKPIEKPHDQFCITSPALLLPSEFNISEIFAYQSQTGKIAIPFSHFLEQSEFSEKDAKKPVKYFSSGMLQRLKTAFCIFSQGDIKLFDEPLSNMDKEGEKWYINCVDQIRRNHIIIVASNYAPEFQFTDHAIQL